MTGMLLLMTGSSVSKCVCIRLCLCHSVTRQQIFFPALASSFTINTDSPSATLSNWYKTRRYCISCLSAWRGGYVHFVAFNVFISCWFHSISCSDSQLLLLLRVEGEEGDGRRRGMVGETWEHFIFFQLLLLCQHKRQSLSLCISVHTHLNT